MMHSMTITKLKTSEWNPTKFELGSLVCRSLYATIPELDSNLKNWVTQYNIPGAALFLRIIRCNNIIALPRVCSFLTSICKISFRRCWSRCKPARNQGWGGCYSQSEMLHISRAANEGWKWILFRSIQTQTQRFFNLIWKQEQTITRTKYTTKNTT